jgi:3-dehydroquinate dehydratase/shikimate dehydrogenase
LPAPFTKSLPRICVALGFSTPDALLRAAELEIKDGNTFLELRLDFLSSPELGLPVLKRLLKRNPELHFIATCRHKANNGGFKGSLDEQINILTAAAEAGARIIDLEIESGELLKKRLPEIRRHAALLISYHNFESTPALSSIWKKLLRVEADAYKLVTTARKPSDNLRISEFFRQKHSVPLVAFSMSEIGIPTRILSLAAGCAFTYAAPLESEGTAPGQIPAKLMRTLYRADKLTRHSRVFGVIADPVAHSKSPQLHNRAFQSKRIDAVYLPFRVANAALGDWMKLAEGLPVSGFSVTIPHKQRILRYLDIVDPLARRIGAVNTVWRKTGKWRGTNTDIAGIVKPLEQRQRLSRASVLLAGYGGAARAAAFALHDAGARLTITGRDTARAQSLAKAVGAEVITLRRAEQQHFDIVLNATPVGMHPNSDACLFRENVPGEIAFDMVYNPAETLMLRMARDQRRTVISGVEMFLEQAAEQFEIWTGETAPRALMRQSLDPEGAVPSARKV